MLRILFFLFVLVFAKKAMTQFEKFEDGYTIEKCNVPFALITKEGKSGLLNYKTNEFVIPFDSSFCQYFPEVKCLLKVNNTDSIFCFQLGNYQIDFWVSSYREMKIYQDNSSLSFSNRGQLNTVRKVLGPSNDAPAFFGEFGLEIIDETVIVIDYRRREEYAEIPLLDENGDLLIRRNPRSGFDEYVYPNRKPGYCNGGVRNRGTREWIIAPSANWIVKNHSGFLAEGTRFASDTFNTYFDDSYFTIYNRQGEALVEGLSPSELVEQVEYRKLLVPRFACDSVYPSYAPDGWGPRTFVFPQFYKFEVNGKTGAFYMKTNRLLQEPVDFMKWSSSMGKDCRIEIEENKLSMKLIDWEREWKLEEGFKFEMYSVVGSKNMLCLRFSKSDLFDSVYMFYSSYSNKVDTIEKFRFIDTELPELLKSGGTYKKLYLNQAWSYSVECISSNIVLVNDAKNSFREAQEEWLKSGLFDLESHEWIIPEKYHTILKTNNGYTAYLKNPEKFPDDFVLYLGK